MIQDSQLRTEIVEFENNIQNGEKITEFKQTREELKQIYIERLKMEQALQLRLKRMEIQSPGKNMEFRTVESTRIHDTIFVKYGLKIQHMACAVDLYKFSEDEDIKQILCSPPKQ